MMNLNHTIIMNNTRCRKDENKIHYRELRCVLVKGMPPFLALNCMGAMVFSPNYSPLPILLFFCYVRDRWHLPYRLEKRFLFKSFAALELSAV